MKKSFDNKQYIVPRIPARPVSTVAQPENATNDPVTAAEIAAQVAAFEQKICERAERYSLAWTPGYDMKPITPDMTTESIPLAILLAAGHSSERVSVEKRDGQWRLWFTHQPSVLMLMTSAPPKPTVLLRDASIHVRQTFMQEHAKAFAEEFVAMCNELKARRESALAAGNDALRFLDEN